jgi:hypothetical protein
MLWENHSRDTVFWNLASAILQYFLPISAKCVGNLIWRQSGEISLSFSNVQYSSYPAILHSDEFLLIHVKFDKISKASTKVHHFLQEKVYLTDVVFTDDISILCVMMTSSHHI